MAVMGKVFSIPTSIGKVRVSLEWREKGASWYYRFHLRGHPREYRSTHEKDEREARRVAEGAVLAAVARASVGGQGRVILGEAVRAFLTTRWPDPEREGKESHRDAKNRLERWVDFQGPADLGSAGSREVTAMVQRFLDSRVREGRSAQTVRNDQTVIHAFLGWIRRRHGIWESNPASREVLDMPKVGRKIGSLPSGEWIARVLDHARDRQDQIFPVLVLLLSGLRPKGAVGVRWGDFDWEARVVRTNEKKAERRVPLSSWAVGLLRPLAGRAEDPVWPFNRFTAFDALARIRSEIGAPEGITLQSFRRAAAVRLWEGGAPVQVAARIMGHTIQTATRHYVDLDALGASGSAELLDFSNKKSQNPSQSGGGRFYKSLNTKGLPP